MSICAYNLHLYPPFLNELRPGSSRRSAERIGLSKLIANNTTITCLGVGIEQSGERRIKKLFVGLEKNTTIKTLSLFDFGARHITTPIPNGCVEKLICDMYGADFLDIINMLKDNTTLSTLQIKGITSNPLNKEFEKYLCTASITTLDMYDCDYDMNDSLKSLMGNTRLSTLYLPLMLNYNYNRNDIRINLSKYLLKNTLCKLQILRSDINLDVLKQCSSLTHLLLSYKDATQINLINDFELLQKNLSILEINIFIYNDNYKSIWKNLHSERHDWLLRNRNARWDRVHAFIGDIVIIMAPIKVNFDMIPPYVMLEIIDWICPNNSYSTHLKKINLILGLYNSIRKIPRYTEL